MATQTRVMTAEELIRLPDDGWRYELLKGELRKMAPASHDHGIIGMNLAGALHQHVKAHRLGRVYNGETGFLIARSPDTVRAADVAFVGADRAPVLGQVKGYWPGAPDLAVEVVSPGDSYSEVTEKAAMWLESGTRLVLVVDPRQHTLTVYRGLADIRVLTEADTLDGGEVVPGWTFPVRELFA